MLPDSLIDLELYSDAADVGQPKWLLPFRDISLSPRLQRLTLTDSGEQPLSDLRLPASLASLTLDECNQPLADWSPPAGLRELTLGRYWNQPVSQLRLPPRLQVLTFGELFNQPVADLTLPPSLTELQLGTDAGVRFTHPLVGLRLPPHLRVLSVPSFGYWLNHDSPALLLPPAAGLPASLRELHVSAHAVRFDRLSAWSLPARCVVHARSV